MALVINDRVKVTSTTTGTGAFALGAAVTGFETFAQGIGNNNTTYYCIFNQGTSEFEVGLGTLDQELQFLVVLILTMLLILVRALKMYFALYQLANLFFWMQMEHQWERLQQVLHLLWLLHYKGINYGTKF